MEGKFHRHRGAKIWEVVLFMCYVGNLVSMITKRLKGLSILSPNNTVLRCFFERKTNLGSIPCHFLDFIETLNLSL